VSGSAGSGCVFAVAATGAPQLEQNESPGLSGWPQLEQNFGPALTP
jgi:hypothetical protein